MSGYPLKSVADLRRREEEAAAARLADATRERAAAETEEARRVAEVSAARARWDSARGEGVEGSRDRARGKSLDDSQDRGDRQDRDWPVAAVSGATATDRSRFLARLRDELTRAETTLVAFRSGPLAGARVAEVTARDQHLAARQARDAFDKHEAKFRSGERKVAERREEETLEDVARAAWHPRGDPET